VTNITLRQPKRLGNGNGTDAGNENSGFSPLFAFGGAEGDRTLDLRIANATLSQLSYRPMHNLGESSYNSRS
jgi:hypothetical protein